MSQRFLPNKNDFQYKGYNCYPQEEAQRMWLPLALLEESTRKQTSDNQND